MTPGRTDYRLVAGARLMGRRRVSPTTCHRQLSTGEEDIICQQVASIYSGEILAARLRSAVLDIIQGKT